MAASVSASHASSPPPLAPAPLSAAPSAANANLAAGSSCLTTSKEWVIPPRPKPGRKPATDAPPTKRKAQNRAAQRAFRERRAAKVGQLEGSIKEIGQVYEKTQEEMKIQIATLESEIDVYRGQVLAWQQRYGGLAQELETERRCHEATKLELSKAMEAFSSAPPPVIPALGASTDQAQIAGNDAPELMGCGSCTIDSRCACIEMSLDMDAAPEPDSTVKRAHSPEGDEALSKRARSSPDHSELETDFTALYAIQKSVDPTADEEEEDAMSPTSPVEAADRCGFCEDGTACVCALDHRAPQSGVPPPSEAAPRPATALSSFTPPPSVHDVQPAEVLATSTTPSVKDARCVPGTCAQCRADPKSTLFCKSLAAMQKSAAVSASSSTSPSGSMSKVMRKPPSSEHPYLSCADTYTTLSRHPQFDNASADLGSWLPRLKTSTSASISASTITPVAITKMAAMEVEAASILGVLKMFDRRFGQN
ncbi:MAG: hypothetical protein M1838_005826 [Thelocarpon superellum]|nr:MAG: hypothetical protein M1838_005826 [Thelocarpon superellum]